MNVASRCFVPCFVFALLLNAAVACIAAPPANLLANGAFKQRSAAGAPAGWESISPGSRAHIDDEDGEGVLTVQGATAKAPGGVRQAIAVRPEWAKVIVRGWARSGQMARLDPASPSGMSVEFAWRMKAGGEPVRAAQLWWPHSGLDWAQVNQLLDVPAGAAQLTVTAEVVNATGSASFRGLTAVAWVQTFDDEFDGTSVDTTRWTPSEGNDLVYAPGEQYFAPDHVIVKDGIVTMHADQTSHKAYKPRPPLDGNYANTLYGDYRYESGELRTVGRFQQLYGFWEFRLKIPLTMGTWPAVYLLKWDDGWPPEIDVCESSGKVTDTILQTNVYNDDYGKMMRSWSNLPPSDVDRSQWRTYAVAWEPDAITWYIDGQFKGVTRMPDAGISNVPMYIRMNLAVGTFGGDPKAGIWPQDMLCDFARVYQRHDLPLPLYPEASQQITLPVNTATLSAIGCNPMTGCAARWTLVDGPGPVSIEHPDRIETKATFTKPGMYRFKVRLTRGESAASRELLVYVNAR